MGNLTCPACGNGNARVLFNLDQTLSGGAVCLDCWHKWRGQKISDETISPFCKLCGKSMENHSLHRDSNILYCSASSKENKFTPEYSPDPVNHPSHYTSHPSGVECITVTEHFNFNRGNAIKYIWRAGEKGETKQDLEKAVWYIKREIARLEKHPEQKPDQKG